MKFTEDDLNRLINLLTSDLEVLYCMATSYPLLARCFVSVPHETKLEHYAPHTDLNIEHTVMIYYVNDADGDTILFNDQGDIMKSVTPKKGRVLVFDGSILHGGGIPKKGPRCIVNYDVKVVK